MSDLQDDSLEKINQDLFNELRTLGKIGAKFTLYKIVESFVSIAQNFKINVEEYEFYLTKYQKATRLSEDYSDLQTMEIILSYLHRIETLTNNPLDDALLPEPYHTILEQQNLLKKVQAAKDAKKAEETRLAAERKAKLENDQRNAFLIKKRLQNGEKSNQLTLEGAPLSHSLVVAYNLFPEKPFDRKMFEISNFKIDEIIQEPNEPSPISDGTLNSISNKTKNLPSKNSLEDLDLNGILQDLDSRSAQSVLSLKDLAFKKNIPPFSSTPSNPSQEKKKEEFREE